jgi:hypothetical protein
MSISIGYFFGSSESLSEVASNLHLWLGCDLRPYEGNLEDLYSRFLGMELSLHKNDFLDDDFLDNEPNFSQYDYCLSIRTPLPDLDFRPLQLTTMLSIVYALYRRLQITGMLVFDLQKLLARYETRTNEQQQSLLFDSVSNQWVRFPEHFAHVVARIPSGAIEGVWEISIDQYLHEQGEEVRPI